MSEDDEELPLFARQSFKLDSNSDAGALCIFDCDLCISKSMSLNLYVTSVDHQIKLRYAHVSAVPYISKCFCIPFQLAEI